MFYIFLSLDTNLENVSTEICELFPTSSSKQDKALNHVKVKNCLYNYTTPRTTTNTTMTNTTGFKYGNTLIIVAVAIVFLLVCTIILVKLNKWRQCKFPKPYPATKPIGSMCIKIFSSSSVYTYDMLSVSLLTLIKREV